MLDGYQLREEYTSFLLSYPWDCYSTITYRRTRKDGIAAASQAWKVFERFEATRMFIAVEPHLLDGIHLHCLSRHLSAQYRPGSNIVPPGLWKYCFKAFGRSRIEPISDTVQVSRYCAKYVVKGNQYEFFGFPEAWRQDRY